MKDYLLFIDTEASGLPKKWNLPYDAKGNWPNSVQISWIIYTQDGQYVKEEDHYIKDDDFAISDSAIKIHGITRDFLQANGECRKEIMELLAKDVSQFQPLVVGHFMEFDQHMIGADFYRTGIENPIKKEDTFCTMVGTRQLVKNPAMDFLRLDDLYEMIFDKPFNNPHNAIADAKATAACFFELCKRGQITDETIKKQQEEIYKKDNLPERKRCALLLLSIISFTILILYLL